MKILLISDGIACTTGFAQINRALVKELIKRYHTVEQICCMDTPPFFDSAPYFALGVKPYPTDIHDGIGITFFKEVIAATKPDVIVLHFDPGTCYSFFDNGLADCTSAPIVVYAPVEGAPILPHYAEAFRNADSAFCYTEWGSKQLAKEHQLDVGVAHPGVDTSIFKPLEHWERTKLREELGWTDRYVVTYVARNVRRKNHDRLIKALAILQETLKIDDVLLYLHCKAFDNFTMQGWDLNGIAHWAGVTDDVQFSNQTHVYHAESPYSLHKKLAASDLYVHAASVEGWGLPIVEAMACGVPVITVQDNGNIDEATGDAAIAKIMPYDYETFFNSAQLAQMHPMHIAQAIATAKDLPQSALKLMRERALCHAATFSWEEMAGTLTDAIESMA